MTNLQEIMQCDGPNRPTAAALAALLNQLPPHVEIRAISIKGQGGEIAIEYMHEDLPFVASWKATDYNRTTLELLWERHP